MELTGYKALIDLLKYIKNRMRLTYCMYTMLVIAVLLVTSSVSVNAATTKTITGVSRYDYAYQVLEKSNAARVKQGKNELTMDSDLLKAAMARAAECAVNFDHIRPNGENCFALDDKIYAENLAAGQESPAEVVEDWLASSGHRTNLLNNDYNSIGVGVFEYDNRIYWVELFGRVGGDGVGEPDTGSATYQIALAKSEETVLLKGAGITTDPLAGKISNVKLTAGKNKLTLTWNKKTGIAGYQVQISDKKSFKNPKTYTLAKSKKKLVIKKYKGKKLKSKKRYYVRIRAYKEFENVTATSSGDSTVDTASTGVSEAASDETAGGYTYSKWCTVNKKVK